jgi:cobaltochelatase CobT
MKTDRQEVLTITTRALAKDKTIALSFGSNQRKTATNLFTAPALTSELSGAQATAELRGELDHQALMHRYHSPIIHREYRPTHVQAGKLFDALEEARVDAFGSHHMQGVQQNIATWRAKSASLNLSQSASSQQDDVLANILSALARSHFTGLEPPENLRDAVDRWRLMVEHKAEEELALLADSLGNQAIYAKQSIALLKSLGILEEFSGNQTLTRDKTEQQPEVNDNDAKDVGEQEDDNQDFNSEGLSASGEKTDDDTPPQSRTGAMHALMGDVEVNAPIPAHFDHNEARLPHLQYKIFTKKYDEVVTAKTLASAEELRTLNQQLAQKLLPLQATATRMAHKLQHLLLARQNREWLVDQEEGILDAKRLTRVVTAPSDGLYFKREKKSDFKDTIVTLLIDNSGSMRGRPITIAALSASILGKTLERCGVKVEVLGFTTRDWKGGQAAREWQNAGKPPNPGRLNDLRHIIYKSADQPWLKAHHSIGLMLKEGLLKENIDGEAILWAADRLNRRPEERRILMVVSDGAPVDDSTLSSNHGSYLDQHLREVIAHIENHTSIELLAIGIGHDVTRYYKRAITISDAQKLPEVMGKELLDLFKA